MSPDNTTQVRVPSRVPASHFMILWGEVSWNILTSVPMKRCWNNLSAQWNCSCIQLASSATLSLVFLTPVWRFLSPYVRGRQILKSSVMEWGSDEDRSSCRLSVQITVQNPEVNRNLLGSIRLVVRKPMSKIALPYCPQESICLECSHPTSGESHHTSSLCWMSERALFQVSRKRMGHANTLLLTSRFHAA